MTRVAGQQPEHRGEGPKRRGRAAVAVSLAVHAVVLAIIGLNVPRPVYREPPPSKTANIWLMPRLTPQQHKTAAPVAVQAPPRLAPTQKPPLAPQPSPIQSAATNAPGKPAPAGAPPGPPPSLGSDSGQGVREALRTTVGCDADRVVRLTPAEQARCNQSVGEMASKPAPFMGIDPLKRGRFDAQAEADERRRAAREGPMQELVVPCTGQGSNFGMGCLPDSAIMHIHQH
jgi:hypothetical protein